MHFWKFNFFIEMNHRFYNKVNVPTASDKTVQKIVWSMTPRTSCGHTEIGTSCVKNIFPSKGVVEFLQRMKITKVNLSQRLLKKNVFQSFVSHVQRNNIYFNKFGFRNNDSINGEILQNWSCSNKVIDVRSL